MMLSTCMDGHILGTFARDFLLAIHKYTNQATQDALLSQVLVLSLGGCDGLLGGDWEGSKF